MKFANLSPAFFLFAALCKASLAEPESPWKFDFGAGPAAAGYTQVTPASGYSKEAGFGFEPGGKMEAIDRGGSDALSRDFCTSSEPFFFSVALPEGNYKVTVTLGDPAGESTTT